VAATNREERAARLRAARAYSGMTFVELAERAGVPVGAVKKAAAFSGPRMGVLNDDAMARVGDAAGIPPWFMTNGWLGAVSLDELFQALIDGHLDTEVRARYAAMLYLQAADRLDADSRELLWRAVMSVGDTGEGRMRELIEQLRDPDSAAATGKTVSPAADTGKFADRAAKTGKVSSALPRVEGLTPRKPA